MPKNEGKLRQRADYTHKFNARQGRHGWLRLTPAYSVKAVEEIISRYGEDVGVLDPFCGTGTTALCAVNRRNSATTIDINPFLVWLARAKTANYSSHVLATAECIAKDVVEMARSRAVKPAQPPPIYHIERWWPPHCLDILRYLQAAIFETTDNNGEVADLINVAFCRTLINLSNVSFSHQSMSFRSEWPAQPTLICDVGSIFYDDICYVIDTARQNPTGNSSVIQGDARDLEPMICGHYDVVITSPPYANRMSYIRELRPYMYWLGYLASGRDAGELDWRAIGGTWGIATSRLTEWAPSGDWWAPDELQTVVAAISDANETNGKLLATYVRKYFDDISHHFCNLKNVLNAGAELHYIIGNSSFYGVLVSTENFYAAILREYGFNEIDVRPIRKRNSKKELLEFIVSARWPG